MAPFSQNSKADRSSAGGSGHAHPGLNLDEWLVRLDEIAGRWVTERSPAALAQALFVTDGYVGNTDDYTDPRNSLLDDVIDRRLGIPITLSVLAMLLGGTAAGVALRAHPFMAGTIVTTLWVAGTWRGLALVRSARKYAASNV